MFSKLMAALGAIKSLDSILKTIDSWLKQIIAYIKNVKIEKINEHYAKKKEELDQITKEIEIERNKKATPESDKKLEELLRKRHGLKKEVKGDKSD